MKWRRAFGLLCLVGLAGSTVGLALLSANLYRRDKLGRVGPPGPAEIVWSSSTTADRRALIIGDSRARSLEVKRSDRSTRIGRQSYPGMTSAQIVPAALATIEHERPQKVVLYFGINDLVAASLSDANDADQIVANLVARFIQVRDHGQALGIEVACVAIPPPADHFSPRRWLARSDLVNLVTKTNQRLAQAFGPEAWIEPNLPVNQDGQLRDTLATDELHLTTAAGSETLKAIEAWLEKRR